MRGKHEESNCIESVKCVEGDHCADQEFSTSTRSKLNIHLLNEVMDFVQSHNQLMKINSNMKEVELENILERIKLDSLYLKLLGKYTDLDQLGFVDKLYKLSLISLELGLSEISVPQIQAAQSRLITEAYEKRLLCRRLDKKIRELEERKSQSQSRCSQLASVLERYNSDSVSYKKHEHQYNKDIYTLDKKTKEYESRLIKANKDCTKEMPSTFQNSIDTKSKSVATYCEDLKEKLSKLYEFSDLPPDLEMAYSKLQEAIKERDSAIEERNKRFFEAFQE